MNLRFCFNRKGQSTVEFSFVLMMVIVITLALTDLTRIAYNWMVLQYAASEASRFGSLGQIDPGFATREDSIRSRITQMTSDLGLDNVNVEFIDESGGSTAGASLEYYRLRLSRTLYGQALVDAFLRMGGIQTYQVVAWTVIRNEPF